MMQRDETVMLHAWVRYHAHLVGFEGLVLYDNGSTDPQTAAILERAERAGADVRRQHDQASDFEHRHIHFRRLADIWDAAGEAYGVTIPLECDEFLAVYTEDGVSCRRERILAALEAREGDRRAAVCAAGLTFDGDAFAVGSRRVTVFPERAETELDVQGTKLTVLGFGGTSEGGEARVVFQGLAKLLEAFGVREARLGSPAATKRAGAEDAVWVRARAGAPARRFRGSAYLKRHQDVAEAGWPALLHYAAMGVREGREV